MRKARAVLRDRQDAMLDILLVDDEPDFRTLVGDALRDAGHRVTLAGNGAEALTIISSNVFDVMICDIRLPKVDGLTLFRRVRQESPSTDVILITAYAEVVRRGRRPSRKAPTTTSPSRSTSTRSCCRWSASRQRALKRELEQARAELSQRKASARTAARRDHRAQPADAAAGRIASRRSPRATRRC